MKIIVTGLTGLVGSRLEELYGKTYEFENLSREAGVDITDSQAVKDKITSSSAKIVLHMTAKTNVDSCELDKEKDLKAIESGNFSEVIAEKTAWAVNVLGTKNVIDACEQGGKRLIYVSTDFVFDGKKNPNDPYTEEDISNPINWYGETKCEGEKIVQNSKIPWAIIRPAYPYRTNFKKNDFFRAILEKLRNGEKIRVVYDHIMCPTFIDDLAKVFDCFFKSELKGIYHAVGSQFLSPFDAAVLTAKTFDLNVDLISQTTREEYFENKAPRPFFLGLKNDKIKTLGIKMLSFEEGLLEIKKQIV